jgi:hypothetical protein
MACIVRWPQRDLWIDFYNLGGRNACRPAYRAPPPRERSGMTRWRRGRGFVDEAERIVLRGGALDGKDAELVIVPRGIPHLWALTDELVVTVSGDLSRAELLRVAESLEKR